MFNSTHTLRYLLAATMIGMLPGAHAQTLQWAHAIGGSSQDAAQGVAIDGSGAVITIGSFVTAPGGNVDLNPGPGVHNVSANNSSQDIFVRKVAANGTFLWGFSLGGTSTDEGNAVTVDASDNVIITGRIGGTVDLDPGPGVVSVTTNVGFDVFVIKFSSTGAFVWGKVFGGPGADSGLSIGTDGFGNICSTGILQGAGDMDPGPGTATRGGNGLNDIFVQKLDASGNFVWAHGLGGTGNDQGWSIAVAVTGHTTVAGEFRSSFDFDPGPGVVSHTSAGDADMFLLRLDAAGNLQWANRFGGSSTERAKAVALDALGNCVITGLMTSATDMDPGPGFITLPGSNFEDSFVAKFNSTGAHVWSFLLTGFLNVGNGITVDALNNVYTAGVFFGAMDVDPGPGVTTLTPNTGRDGYLLRYSPSGTFEWAFHLNGSASLGPQSVVARGAALATTGAFGGTVDMQPGAGVTNITALGMDDGYTALYTIGAGPLSVELSAFAGERIDATNIRLNWSTAAEEDNKGFEVWRALQGSEAFHRIAWLEGMGNSQSTYGYSFVDTEASPFVSYYRLRQIDHDGTSEDSPVVVVNAATGESGLLVFPDPASGPIDINMDRRHIARIDLLDGSGRVVRSWSGGEPLTVEGSPGGTYVLRVRTTDGVVRQGRMMIP